MSNKKRSYLVHLRGPEGEVEEVLEAASSTEALIEVLQRLNWTEPEVVVKVVPVVWLDLEVQNPTARA
jgi:hypothetical protein